MPTYAMSMYLLPSSVIERMDKARKRFFWQGGGTKRKYHLVKWEKITKPKKEGGLGVKDLRRMNISLLCRWWWKLENEEGIWQEIVRHKYMKNKWIAQLSYKASNSPVWNDLIKIKHYYTSGRVINLGNGKNVDFWNDSWCGSLSLKDRFPNLFEICFDQKCSVATICHRKWRLHFRRWLSEELQNQLRDLHNMLFKYKCDEHADKAIWKWEKSGKFSVKSLYKHTFGNGDGEENKQLWNAKLPLKIKIFMWLTLQDSILTKDNLLKRKWKGSAACVFCQEAETVRHLMFECPIVKYVWSIIAFCFGAKVRPNSFTQYWVWINRFLPEGKQVFVVGLAAVCWSVWKTRNNVCFEEKRMKAPTEIICLICSTLIYWAGLQKGPVAEQMEQGAEALKKTALHFHHQVQMEGCDNRMAIV
jgi:hypothetical protein